MTEPLAKFQIDDSFRITGRGIVFAGVIIEGLISVGDQLEFEFKSQNLKRRITGVEGFSGRPKSPQPIGILIKTNNPEEESQLREWNPQGIIGIVTRPAD